MADCPINDTPFVSHYQTTTVLDWSKLSDFADERLDPRLLTATQWPFAQNMQSDLGSTVSDQDQSILK